MDTRMGWVLGGVLVWNYLNGMGFGIDVTMVNHDMERHGTGCRLDQIVRSFFFFFCVFLVFAGDRDMHEFDER